MSQAQENFMEVEDTPVDDRKRERDFEDEDGEGEPDLIPTEMPDPRGPRRELTLGDLMAAMNQQRTDIMESVQKGMAENRTNFSSLRADVGAAKREAQEARGMAAKATTLAQETKESVESLEKRVALLEKGGAKTGEASSSHRVWRSGGDGPKRDWDQLGGDDGDQIIVGGFRPYASREERQQDWDVIKGELPEDLVAQISDTIVPASACRIIIVNSVPCRSRNRPQTRQPPDKYMPRPVNRSK